MEWATARWPKCLFIDIFPLHYSPGCGSHLPEHIHHTPRLLTHVYTPLHITVITPHTSSLSCPHPAVQGPLRPFGRLPKSQVEALRYRGEDVARRYGESVEFVWDGKFTGPVPPRACKKLTRNGLYRASPVMCSQWLLMTTTNTLRSITRNVIKEARAKELKAELLNSEVGV